MHRSHRSYRVLALTWVSLIALLVGCGTGGAPIGAGSPVRGTTTNVPGNIGEGGAPSATKSARALAPLRVVPAVPAVAQVVITPTPTTAPLFNPGKGWSTQGLPSNVPKDVLGYVGMGVVRFDWAALEPKEGVFDWTPVERTLAEWNAIGRVCNIGVMCANTHSGQPGGYVTPKWVFDAGAKCYEMDLTPDMSTSGTPGHKIAPVFDDPIFLAKYRDFLNAFARRFDGDPRIALLDIRSYGNWGEGHMWPFNVPDISPAKYREHVQMHVDAFKRTQLCISRNSHLGQFGPLKEVFDWAVQTQRIAPRRDGICGNSDGKETAIGLGISPGVFELYGPYEMLKQLGWWDGKKDRNGLGFRLADCVENGRPSWVDISREQSSLRLLNENRDLVNRLTNRMGYHFHLRRAAFPASVTGAFNVDIQMQNLGVAPIYITCATALALIDAQNKRVAVTWPDALKPQAWQQDRVTAQTATVNMGKIPAGTYRLGFAITPKAGNASPFVKLGTNLPMVDGWYVLGTLKVSVK